MSTAIEYFHTLVEDKFTRDQYEVTYTDGKYHVILTVPDKNPMSYYFCTVFQKRMEKCVEGLIRPENFKLEVIPPIRLKMYHDQKYQERLNKILRIKTKTNDPE
jgi:hypothetical protein